MSLIIHIAVLRRCHRHVCPQHSDSAGVHYEQQPAAEVTITIAHRLEKRTGHEQCQMNLISVSC
jgi:hypothetical protein